MSEQEAEYIQENYGSCAVSPCTCNKGGRWVGTICPNWRPIKEKSFKEVLERLKNERKGKSN